MEKKSPKEPEKLASFHLVDPAREGEQVEEPSDGFHLSVGGSCAVRATSHYRLAFQPGPEGWTSGYHEIAVTTPRPHVTLSYQHRYFVGATEAAGAAGKAKQDNGFKAGDILALAACGRSPTPASIALKAKIIPTAGTDPLRFSVAIQPSSLAFASISDEERRVQLDYGACTFGADGKPIYYTHTTADRALSPDDYARVLANGLPNLWDLSRKGNPAFARFAVRDRVTGNVGWTIASTSPPLAHLSEGYGQMSAANQNDAIETFGSILPKPGALCGDVYEIQKGTAMLPRSFWDMDSAGSIYADSLNLPLHFLTDGIPGVTSRSEWFAIDYYGHFWVTVPGEYRFALAHDDGAELFIDDKMLNGKENSGGVPLALGRPIVLAAGRHTIHLPYFQGPYQASLVLMIQVPGGKEPRRFDLRDFSKPSVEQH